MKTTRAMLKPTKFAGTIKSVTKVAPHIAHVAVEITDSGKTETATYCIAAATTGDYFVTKHGDGNEPYKVNPMRGECGCEGYNRGFNCRHLRMVCKLVSQGKI